MLDIGHLGVVLDDRVINVNGRREYPILCARILLGHALKATPASTTDMTKRPLPARGVNNDDGLAIGLIKVTRHCHT
jgi:hypothetical protein